MHDVFQTILNDNPVFDYTDATNPTKSVIIPYQVVVLLCFFTPCSWADSVFYHWGRHLLGRAGSIPVTVKRLVYLGEFATVCFLPCLNETIIYTTIIRSSRPKYEMILLHVLQKTWFTGTFNLFKSSYSGAGIRCEILSFFKTLCSIIFYQKFRSYLSIVNLMYLNIIYT